MSGNDALYLMVVTVLNFCYNRSSPEFAISETNASLDFLAPKWYYWSKWLSEYWPMNSLNINSNFGVLRLKKKSKYSEVSKMVNLFLKFIVKKLVTNHQILSQIKQATSAQNVFRCISLFSFLLAGQDTTTIIDRLVIHI